MSSTIRAARTEQRRERRAKAEDFIATVKANHSLKNWEYVIRNAKGFDEKVLCKKCDAPLQGFVVIDTENDVVNGRNVIRERMVMAQTAAYQEVALEMADGSAHMTLMCKSCAKRLKPGDYEQIYAADLDEFRKAEQRFGHESPWEALEGRVPVGHKLVG